jgi:hypothetical protein
MVAVLLQYTADMDVNNVRVPDAIHVFGCPNQSTTSFHIKTLNFTH